MNFRTMVNDIHREEMLLEDVVNNYKNLEEEIINMAHRDLQINSIEKLAMLQRMNKINDALSELLIRIYGSRAAVTAFLTLEEKNV